jgi:hypothetical protein
MDAPKVATVGSIPQWEESFYESKYFEHFSIVFAKANDFRTTGG